MAGLTDTANWKKRADLMLPLGIVGIIFVMILPVPPLALDLFLTFNITAAIIILLVAVYVKKPLDFSTFPVLLLVTTLFRLSLNVASTRIILLHGADGPEAAGQVIKSFGNFVVGGNYAVGFIVFAILVIINFVVITKGAGRIAEVAARFTLDAMPGKQMAIDADLNAGLIGDDEARRRRKEVSLEADFYGAMDGASKFVRGDAVAGILITVINIVGGLIIGVAQQGLPVGEAAKVYTLLTVGDGLVAQIPALIISTAAGIVVSNVNSEAGLSDSIGKQFLFSPKPLLIASAILFVFGLIPGLPHIAFLTFSIVTGAVGYIVYKTAEDRKAEELEQEKAAARPAAKKEAVDEVPLIDTLSLEVGYRLIPLVDSSEGGELLERVKAIRRQFAEEMGIMVPAVHIKDNLQLKPAEYLFLVKGVEVARGELLAGHSLAIDPGNAQPGLDGVPTTDPAFGLPSIWVPDAQLEKAQLMGYTVVNHSAVIATHVTEVIRGHANEILGRQEVQVLIDRVAKTHPKVVEELVPGMLSLGGVQKVLQNLLKERVSIRDLQTILETLADYASITKDTDLLTEYVRMGLARQITKSHISSDYTIQAIALSNDIEDAIVKSVHETPQGSFLTIEPGLAQRILGKVKEGLEEAMSKGHQPVLLVSHQTRRFVRRLTERVFPAVTILSHNEISSNARVQTLKVVRL
ncbi:MAG TPA: flagellar biosynthesis protein FlhA [Deltaproteobacteria bacterium]|nr:MAG: flagellar biosynthesis protein FlhA [Deltaproteobacteria bacterium GWA2_55_82]OGQ62882.1 MAG: flagellar biosynthesis protein FlhA [Deltaproteobacteria bacterium RIFCSPLOWO2_02_FULL_55_12]OIJ72843.1 MAG: flagellar biosynthesis protein FlhA [Deltaproteobacteria bacterium GWC2_55_46]HBG46122.1 flagellar biosynthesis protein FlhA [Deltaproteobacteria bacterium]HCY11620.1 flagellar biosynthesis protein FlhA [Deltaproteobacteria bacterium]